MVCPEPDAQGSAFRCGGIPGRERLVGVPVLPGLVLPVAVVLVAVVLVTVALVARPTGFGVLVRPVGSTGWDPGVASGQLWRQVDDALSMSAHPFDRPGGIRLLRRGEPYRPASKCLQPVVKSTQGQQVTSTRRPTVGVGPDVVEITVLGPATTPRMATSLMEGDDLVDQGLGWLVATLLVGAMGVVTGAVLAQGRGGVWWIRRCRRARGGGVARAGSGRACRCITGGAVSRGRRMFAARTTRRRWCLAGVVALGQDDVGSGAGLGGEVSGQAGRDGPVSGKVAGQIVFSVQG